MAEPLLEVAVPWSLSHYIPLNGFHPLYRPLFDHVPGSVSLNAWDNVKLYRLLRDDATSREFVLAQARAVAKQLAESPGNSVAVRHREYCWPPNLVLTAQLKGDIEFHHTAPFPSMLRPFVLHCEMFSPVLFPFAHQGTGGLGKGELDQTREYYRSILGHPLCLGIWSHVPETLQSFRTFFSDDAINAKLVQCRVGLSSGCTAEPGDLPRKPPLDRPRFLFTNSAHQNPVNFFRRGGHIVLRFWTDFLAAGHDGLLMLRCTRPTNEALAAYGVDVGMVQRELGRSIIWAEDYISSNEIRNLMAHAHLFLLPSRSLHSVSIMQAMSLGAIPVVTDTVGTSVYVRDGETGIVLTGIREGMWRIDESSGILVDEDRQLSQVDDALVRQMTQRVCALLEQPDVHAGMRQRAWAHARTEYSGSAFSDHFWNAVQRRYRAWDAANPRGAAHIARRPELNDCLLARNDWARSFEAPTQPLVRIKSGRSVVLEWGGAIVDVPVRRSFDIPLNNWCVLAHYFDPRMDEVRFWTSLEELAGRYLTLYEGPFALPGLVRAISSRLKPYPKLHRFAAHIWVQARLHSGLVGFLLSRHRRFPHEWNDIELVKHGIHGYNVIRCGRQYYGILQSEGAFDAEKAESGGYSGCFVRSSAEEVIELICASLPSASVHDSDQEGALPPALVVEGFRGFNIIRDGTQYHAIPQREGAYSPARVVASGYTRIFTGSSAEEVQRAILSARRLRLWPRLSRR